MINENNINQENQENQENKEKSSEVVKCKQCGANMVFDIKSGTLKCPYCDSSEDIDCKVFEDEHDLDNFDESTLKHEEGVITYQCPNCHAKTVMREFGTSAKCPFCGATNILTIDDIPGIVPDAILPFKITNDVAVLNSVKWIKRKFFAPSKLKKSFNADNMNALYAPTFTFDSVTQSYYEGRLGKTYTVTVGSGKNRHTETRVRWFRVSGNYNRKFDDLLVEACQTLDQKQINKIGNFDTENAVEYQKEYIAGLASERHDIGVNEAFTVAKHEMTDILRSEILSKYSYDRVDYLNVNTKYRDSTFKHILVPLWCCSYKYKKKLYRYFVNGRSGCVGGKTPLSPIKIAIVSLVALAVLYAIYYFFFR